MDYTEVGTDIRGDNGVLGFWYPIRMCVFDVCVVETDAYTYAVTQPHKVLTQNEMYKKGKYLEA